MTGQRLPAEWEQQSALMLTWPHPGTDWQPYLDDVNEVYLNVVKAASEYQAILICCNDESHRNDLEKLVNKHRIGNDRCLFYIAPSNDSWARDHGPISLVTIDKPVLLDFVFNGWGNKYPCQLDDKVNSNLYQAGAFNDCKLYSRNFVLEGGSLETDGQGTLLTTTSCLLSKYRNPAYNQQQIEQYLKQNLNVQRVIWIQHGHLQGDDTDGHIDTLVRFADTETLLYVSPGNMDNPNYNELDLMQTEVSALSQADGKPYNLVPLPNPEVRNDDGTLLPASYANFVIINHAILAPQYQTEYDSEVIDILGCCFPNRKIIGIDCSTLIRQFGSLHCITMNIPAGVIQ